MIILFCLNSEAQRKKRLDYDLIKIPSVTFVMGKTHHVINFIYKIKKFKYNNIYEPAHNVRLQNYFIGKYEVTNYQYFECVTGGKCSYDGSIDQLRAEPEEPVVGVSWYQADKFCKNVGLRLPTEAEWEATAKGGENHIYPWGDEISCKFANFGVNTYGYSDMNCNGINPGKKVNVGTYKLDITEFGNYDMGGNVSEWVFDWFAPYQRGDAENPKGPQNGTLRVVRGGSFSSSKVSLYTYMRDGYRPEKKSQYRGFRCAANHLPP